MKKVSTIFGWKALAAFLALAVCALMLPSGLFAQTPAPASIHGHVNNPAGVAISAGDVKLTTNKTGEAKDRKYPFSFPIDKNGDFKGTGIAPGSYLGVIMVETKTIDYVEFTVAPGEDKLVNFDMTRKEYIDKMTPEERKAVEEFKKKNAEVSAANAKVANLNASLTSARADTKAGNFDAAITTMQQATTQKPDEAILWLALGDAQLGSADAAAKAARAAHTSPTDPAIIQKYNDAVASYKKAAETNAASKKPSAETAATAYNQLGSANGKAGNTKDAVQAYDEAAKALPASAGMYYSNEAITMFNSGKGDDAAVAADKAIAADPKRPEPYYIKGQALVSKSTVDPKTQKIVAPPGCLEAYQKYLEIAPDGPYAKEVQEILVGFGQTVRSSYKAGKK